MNIDEVPLKANQNKTTDNLRRSNKRPGGRSARNRKKVFDAVVTLILEKGNTEFTIADIGAYANVHPTSIYRRWETKEKLLLEVLTEHMANTISIPHTGTLRSDLLALLSETFRFLQSPLGSAMLKVSASQLDQPETHSFRQQYFQSRVAHIHELFDRAMQRGEIDPKTDITLILEMLTGPVYSRLLFTARPLEERFAEHIVDSILRNLDSYT